MNTSHLMSKLWAGAAAAHVHCPHALQDADVNCCAIKDLTNDHFFHWRFQPARQQIGSQSFSAKDDYTDPNHLVNPSAASLYVMA